VEAWGELTEVQKTHLKDTLKENPELTAEDLYNKAFPSADEE
jgi:hypothetical protein